MAAALILDMTPSEESMVAFAQLAGIENCEAYRFDYSAPLPQSKYLAFDNDLVGGELKYVVFDANYLSAGLITLKAKSNFGLHKPPIIDENFMSIIYYYNNLPVKSLISIAEQSKQQAFESTKGVWLSPAFFDSFTPVSDKHELHFLWITFSKNWLYKLLPEAMQQQFEAMTEGFRAWKIPADRGVLSVRSNQILENIFGQIDRIDNFMLQVKVYELLNDFYATLNEPLIDELYANKGEVEQIRKYIITLGSSSFERFPKVQQMANDIGMSETKFRSLFTQIYKVPPAQYFHGLKMEKAQELLVEGKLSVMEIGRKIGYQSLGHFSSAFRNYFGQLPKNFIPKMSKPA